MVKNTARPHHPLALLGAALLSAWLAAGGVARAEPPEQDTLAKIVELNREGVAQLQKKHYDAARKRYEARVSMKHIQKPYSIGWTPPARTHLAK